MMKVKYYKCPMCNKKFKTLTGWGDHMKSNHPESIPEGYSIARYFYFTKTGKTHGICRTCKKDTPWNEQSQKYDQYCTNPECKKAYVKIAKQRMIGKYGKIHLLNDPKVQKKMLENRRISGKYRFDDGTLFEYVGSYEKEFLNMMNVLMHWHSNDLISPSPHIYYYDYKNKKDDPKNEGQKFYIPDFFIPSLNLEIEIKQQTSTNQKMNEINRVKEKLKDEVMNSNKDVNYLKINDNNFTEFFEFLANAKEYFPTKEEAQKNQTELVMESLNLVEEINKHISFSDNFSDVMEIANSLSRHDLLRICNGIFKKSPFVKYREVLKVDGIPASFIEVYTLPDMPKNEGCVVLATKSKYRGSGYSNILVDRMKKNIKNIDTLIWDVDSDNDGSIYLANKNGFNEVKNQNEGSSKREFTYTLESTLEIAQEGILSFLGFGKKDDTFSIKSWKDSFRIKKGFFGNFFYTGVKIKDGEIEIHGINYATLKNRIKRFYEDKSINSIFIPQYNAMSYKRFERKKIQRSAIKIDYMHTPEFFALELVTLFTDLGHRFRDKVYLSIANQIYEESWLSTADAKANNSSLLNTSNLSHLKLELKDYQKEFIEKYPKLKAQLNLNGYILSFEQGLGKTLTSIALSECLDVDHVYIVCPNSLKENWALEIKKYYEKYDKDDDLWKQEVFICNSKPMFFNENTTKFIITNNESIEKMFPYIMNGKNMLILDESHNFRNLKSKRVTQLIQLRDKLKCVDTLVMSGTPIKATPDELVPALMLIDPTFTIDAAKIFSKAFKLHSALGTSLVQNRFGKVMYRKEKDVLGDSLPEKHIENLSVSIMEKNKYLLTNVTEVVMNRFREIYDAGYDEFKLLEKPFIDINYKYAENKEQTKYFLALIHLVTKKEVDLHEIDKMFIEDYIKNTLTRISKPEDKKQYQFLVKNYVRYRAHCLGLAFGEILPKYRRDMFIEMYEQNKDMFIKMIKENTKKTLIFSQFKGVVNDIYQSLNDNGVGTVCITGDVKNRMEILREFKDNDSVRVLIATSQTIGTGVTLTEASQMFFFGPPWRDSDFNQCSDRIHRIGQTDEVYIYTVSLDTGKEMNLSTRMDSILGWSKMMTESVITASKDDDDLDNTNFEEILAAEESYLMTIDEFKKDYFNKLIQEKNKHID